MFRCIVRRFVIALFPLVALAASAAAEPHPFSIHDMLAMKRIGAPVLSPDEQRIVFTLRATDLDANKGRTDLWIVGVDGENLRQLTSHPDADGSPQWSRDGKFIYFLSTRDGSSQVWRMSPDGGEATQVTSQPLDVAGFLLSLDGKRLAIAMEVYPDLRKPAETKARLDEEAKKKTSGRVYDRLFFRHWDTWKDGRRSHLFIVPVDEKGRAVDDEAVDITAGMDADIPSKPFGGMEEIAFSHDNSEIVFAARDVGRTEAWSTNLDLFVATVDGKSQPRRLTKDNEALDTSPVFSPDGKALAYLAMSRPGYEADRQRIMMMDWPGGKPMVLAE
jgi:Tol biopolymer transport system component